MTSVAASIGGVRTAEARGARRRRNALVPGWAPWAFLTPFVLVFATFVLYPLAHSVVLSMQQTFGPEATEFVGTRNFRFLLGDPRFWTAVRNTMLFTLGSVCTQIPVGLGLALLLNRPGLRGRAFFRLVFFSPQLVGLVFVAQLAFVGFSKQNGLVNVALHGLFEDWRLDFDWVNDHVMLTLVVATFWMYVGFQMVYFLAALQNVEADQVEAAMIDGAGPWQRFLNVTLPAIRPVAGFVVLLSVIGSLQLFELPYLLYLGSGPNDRALTIVSYLYLTGFETRDLGYASAIGWVLAIMLVVAGVLARALLREGRA